MYRIAFLIIFVCVVSAFCVQELVGQQSEGRTRGQRGQRTSDPPPVPPSGEQPSGEQSTEQPAEGEAQAAAEETAAPEFVPPPPPPPNSLVQIIHPVRADRLGLTDAQRIEANRIVNVQTLELTNAQLAKAPPERFLEIYKQTEEKLSNLLTATQKALVAQGFEGKEFVLVFNRQPWKDVLQLIADQGGYQLIMDAPPLGTFSFEDREKRTITEVLDLINGTLISNGYTVVRKEQILMLLDLRKPVPNRFFPSVKPEELSGRASNEYVSVQFDLERRNRENVLQGIKPLQDNSLYTRTYQLGGNNLLVIADVETLLGIQRVINSTENPPVPPPPKQPEYPKPQVWKTFIIEKNDPDKIESIFTEHVKDAKMLRLPDSRELHIFARTDQQEQFEAILKMLEEDSGAGVAGTKLVSYWLVRYFDPQGLPLNLRGGMGRGGYGMRNFDPSMVPQGVDPSQYYQMQLNPVFRFGMEVIGMLKSAFPKARISDMPVAERIVIFASEADHESIKEFFETLRPAEENRQMAKLYQFVEKGKKMNADTEQQIQTLLPNARTTLDTDRGQILVIATVREHEELEKMVKELEAAAIPTEDRVLRSYQLSPTTINTFLSLTYQLASQNHLRGYIPIRDVQRNQYLIWATEKQHRRIDEVYREVMGQSEQEGGNEPDAVVMFTPKNIDVETLQTVIQDVYPTAKITVNTQRRQFVIRVRPKQKDPLELLLAQLDAADPDEEKRYYKGYPIESGFYSLTAGYSPGRPTQFLAELAELVPDAKISLEPLSQQIIVWGTKEEHTKIEEAIRHLLGDKSGEKTFRVFPLRRVEWSSIAGILRRVYPEPVVEYTHDLSTKQLFVQGHPKMLQKVAELIEVLDPEEPAENDPVVRFYKFEKEPTSTLISGLQRLAPAALIVQDGGNRQIMVIARPDEHKIIEKNTENIVATFAEPERIAKRFEFRRMHYTDAARILDRAFPYPSAIVSFGNAGQYLTIEAYPDVMPKIIELLESLDPLEPTESDFVVKFYQLNQEVTPLVLDALQRLAPSPSLIVPDKKQIMVVAKPFYQKIIEENTQFIVETISPVEEPVLGIYTVTKEERERLTAFIMDIAGTDLRDAKIFPGGDGTTTASADSMLIWARPTEHELIDTVLKQFKESQATAPERQFKSFPMSVGDLETAQSIIQATHPDAMLFPDATGNRLMVLATAEDMEKVTRTLRVQGSIDDRAMIAYPVAGVSPETIRTVITDVYQGLKINVDEVSRKIFIWASPDEHVKIGEIIEQANKEVDPDSELSEKFMAYESANLDTAMIVQLFETMLPRASVYARQGEDKIVVRAIARDHQQIGELFEKLREKDERFRPSLKVFAFGDVPPVMIEALLQNQLPDAESMSPDELIRQLGWYYYYRRMASIPGYFYYSYNYNIPQTKKEGYYKVDPQSRTVHVFITGEQHEIIGAAMEQLITAGNQAGITLTVRRYSMTEIEDFYDVQQIIRRIAPNAMYQMIYERVPSTYSYNGYTYETYNWRTTGDFLAYTSDGEHEKLEALMKELSDTSGIGRKELLSITLPENTPFSREKIIVTLQKVFSDLTPMPGATPNQIIFWATKHRLELIQKMVDEVCQPLPEEARTIPKSYALRHISVEEAVTWLSALHPNAAFDPEKLTTTEATTEPPVVRPTQRADEAKIIVAVATPLEHLEIEKTISELDKELPEHLKMMPREYALDDMPAGAFQPFLASLGQVFPNAVITPSPQGMSVLVVAIEDDHKKIAEFVRTYRDDNERKRPRMEIYTLEWLNYYQVSQLVQRIAPTAAISAGSRPEQIAVWAPLKEQMDIAEALATMETAAKIEGVTTQRLKLYKTGTGKAYLAASMLCYQFPSALTFAINDSEMLAWASPVIHEAMESMLESVAEVYPDPIVQIYFFKNLPLTEGVTILQQAFAGQMLSITPRPTMQDVSIFALPSVHEKIAASIAQFDLPKPAGMEISLKFYDMSDLPADMFSSVTTQLLAAVQNRAQVLPGIVPGQMAVWARPDDHVTIKGLVDQILAGGLVPQSQVFDLSDLTPAWLSHAMSQIPSLLGNRVTVVHGAAPGHLLVMGKPADLKKVEAIVAQLLEEHPNTTATTETYTIYRGNAKNLDTMIRQIAPGAYIDYGTTPNQVLVRAKESDHRKIKELVDRVNESDADVTLKPYFFKHISLQEAASVLTQVFPNSATFVPRYTSGELLVFAASDVHQQIADSIANFDVVSPEGTKHEARTYDLSDLPVWWFNFAHGHIPGAVGQYVYALPTATPGQLVFWAKPADHEKISAIVEQMRSDNADFTMEMKVYNVRRGGTSVSTIINSLIPQIAPNARPYMGTNANQIVVMAKASDHVKVKKAIDSLNQSDGDISLQTYRTGAQRAQTAITLLSQQFPGLSVHLVSPSEIMAWATSAEHETIAQLLETFTEAYPDPVLKPYYFKHVTLSEAYSYLYQVFSSSVTTLVPRTSGDLLVYATPEIHERIAASIAEFDVPRPEGTELISKVYDLSDLSSTGFSYALSYMPYLLDYRVRATMGMSGQLVVWGKPADLEKVDKMIEDLLAERPAATSFTQVYTLQRATNIPKVQSALSYIAPNAQPSLGTKPNQLLIWARAADHVKIKTMVDTLNESEPDIQIELYSLKHIDRYTALRLLSSVIRERGYDIEIFDDYYNTQLVVLANAENQKMVTDVLESLRAEEREVLTVMLQSIDPYTAESAITTQFAENAPNDRPRVTPDYNTNWLIIHGVPRHLEQIAKMLRGMGENVWYPERPEIQRQPSTGGFHPRGNIRELRGSAEMLKELEKLWKQSQPNQLRIINPPQETSSSFSLEDEIQRGSGDGDRDGRRQTADEDLAGIPVESEQSEDIGPAPVYVVVKIDGSMTIVSEDTAALDRLEMLLNRLNTGIVYEGRDYTIYSVRNISAEVVHQRLLLPLRDKMSQSQMRFTGTARPANPLTMQVDTPANNIIVWGTKADRLEVGKLIALFDVSELPGERMVTKPRTVAIENTEATRVWNEVMKVYQVKLNMTQLPGGMYPQIIVNNTTNSLEIFAPEPLLTELAEYIKEVDEKAQEEPGRKLHVIQTGVKASVIQQAIFDMQRQMRLQQQMQMQMQQPYFYPSPYAYPGMR